MKLIGKIRGIESSAPVQKTTQSGTPYQTTMLVITLEVGEDTIMATKFVDIYSGTVQEALVRMNLIQDSVGEVILRFKKRASKDGRFFQSIIMEHWYCYTAQERQQQQQAEQAQLMAAAAQMSAPAASPVAPATMVADGEVTPF